MPSSSGAVPKYRKHSSGRARVTINGQDFYLGPWNSKTSIREYDRIVAEFLASGRSPSYGLKTEVFTVAMLVRDFLRHCKVYYGTGVSSDYHRIKTALKPLAGLYFDHAAADFGPVGFEAVRQTMIEAGLTRQGINARMKKIARAFKWAGAKGKIPAEVYATIRLIDSLKIGRTVAPEAEPIQPIDDDIVSRTRQHLSPILSDMVLVQRLTGCRPGEACNLTVESFDRSNDVWIAELVKHKTQHHGHRRRIYFGPREQAVVMPYLDRDPGEHLFRPCDVVAHRREQDAANRKTPLSCGNRPGKRRGGLKGNKAKKPPGDFYTTNSYRRAIHNGCDRAYPPPAPLCRMPNETEAARKRRLSADQLKELKAWQSSHRWGPNRMRHTRATEIRREHGLEGTQVSLGHKSADITQIYAERDEQLAIDIARLSI